MSASPQDGGVLARSQPRDRNAFDEQIGLAYGELRRLAHRHRLRWTGDETLGTTALVHEAYIKLAEKSGVEYTDPSHLLAIAARAMRHILVDYYRAKRTGKRGGGADRVLLHRPDEVLGFIPNLDPAEEEAILALDESLQRLARESERHARTIDCRYFGGLTIEETARALGLSVATVKRSTSVARAWLARDMESRR